jgi:uncharacterized membrane protein
MSATEREQIQHTTQEYQRIGDTGLQQSGPQRINVGVAERWLSAVGGGALAGFGLWRRSWLGWTLAAVGSALAWRGISGHCATYQTLGISTAQCGTQGIKAQKSVTINASPEELYRFWRNFENLPQFMRHLQDVTVESDTRSHWVANAPAGTSVAWDAEIIDDQPSQRIAWRSLPDADVDNTGEVRFVRGPDGRGTEVHVSIAYNPPAGHLGATIAKLFGEEPNQQIADDLRRFKMLIETGEIATTEQQPHGQRSLLGKAVGALNSQST